MMNLTLRAALASNAREQIELHRAALKAGQTQNGQTRAGRSTAIDATGDYLMGFYQSTVIADVVLYETD